MSELEQERYKNIYVFIKKSAEIMRGENGCHQTKECLQIRTDIGRP